MLGRSFIASFLLTVACGSAGADSLSGPLTEVAAIATPVREPAQPQGTAAAVIPPGQEQLFGEILGRGLAFPGDCSLVSGGMEYSVATATYNCTSGEVVVQLAHPRQAGPNSTTTGRFAVTVTRGAPPPGFTEALLARIRSKEAPFVWSWIYVRSPYGPPLFSRSILIATASVMLVMVGLYVLRRRYASRNDH